MPKHTVAASLELNLEHWKSNDLDGVHHRLCCLICSDGIWRQPKHCPKHERTEKHRNTLNNLEVSKSEATGVTGQSFPNSALHDLSASNTFNPVELNGTVGSLGNALRLMESMDNIRVDFDYAAGPEEHQDIQLDDIDYQFHDGMKTPPVNENLNVQIDVAGFAFQPSIQDSITSKASDALEVWLVSGPSIDTYSDDEVGEVQESDSDDYAPDINLIKEIIFGTVEDEGGPLQPWILTDPIKGNRWRELSKGSPVYAFPIWLYCDDTSGNTSKRWNKHNSFLFVPAGLSHEYVHLEYNVHFLSTSNIADPLEMSEAITDQILQGQNDGIWAWDCVASQTVLLIPSVMALLGDNPMQSEFSCHIGLGGKYFCRICYVFNPVIEDEKNDDPRPAHAAGSMSANDDTDGDGDGNNSEAVSDGGVDHQTEDEGNPVKIPDDAQGGASTAKDKSKKKGKQKKKPAGKRKKAETLAQLIARAHDFLTIAKMRRKSKTLADLRKVYEYATSLGGITKTKAFKTDNGIKDNYQEFFIEKSSNFIRDLKGNTVDEKKKKLKAFVDTLPSNPINPLFRIPGLDAHLHSPVKILHVVLLGFEKYFWRDAMSRIDKKHKPLLITRLSSLDTTGLGISPIAGKNLVQWSGSLVGRDFRVIVQVAPFVLYDLLPQECYDAWLTLCALIPLVWQPVIFSMEKYLVKLQNAIDRFLNLTVKLTPRWLNKPKYHLLLHLPQHIRLFGPVILFATETFESYNAIIRDLSVHSNCQAPSRDIGRGFANMNRIRHLTSGGKFHMDDFQSLKTLQSGKNTAPTNSLNTEKGSKKPTVHTPGYFQDVGKDMKDLIDENPVLRKLLNIPEHEEVSNGSLRRDEARTRKRSNTQSSRVFERSTDEAISRLKDYKFIGFKSCNLQNDDSCTVGSWVIAQNSRKSPLFIGKVLEILQVSASPSDFSKRPDLFLLSIHSTDVISRVYQMPKVVDTKNHVLVDAHVLHNCADNHCTNSAFRPQKQEQADVNQLISTISHINTNDFVLNCAKMRDFCFTQEFCTEFPVPNCDICIHHGAVQELNARRRRNAAREADAAAQLQNTGIATAGDSETAHQNFAQSIQHGSHHTTVDSSVSRAPSSYLPGATQTGRMRQQNTVQRQKVARPANPLDRVQAQGQ